MARTGAVVTMKAGFFILRFLFVSTLIFAASRVRAEEVDVTVEEPVAAVELLADEVATAPSEATAAEPADVVAAERVTEANPVVAGLEQFLAELAKGGVVLKGDDDFAALYECVARVADSAARLLNAEGVAHLENERQGRDFYVPLKLTVSNAVPVVVESGAESNAVQVGDRVLSIAGVSTTNATLSGVLELLRGHEAGRVALVLERGDAVVTASVERIFTELPALELVEVWPRQIGYVKVSGLVEGAKAGEAIVSLLREWAATNFAGAVLDLRGADGADVASAVAVASPFASAGSLLFSMKDREWNDLSDYLARDAEALALPLMVLVDEKTSGAAELVAVAAADSLRGVLVIGQPTAGDPGIRDVVPLADGRGVYIATRQLVSGAGAVYDGREEVVPTIQVSSRANALGFEPEPGPDRRAKLAEEATDRALRDRVRGDAALQRAVDVLLGLKALNIRTGSLSSEDSL